MQIRAPSSGALTKKGVYFSHGKGWRWSGLHRAEGPGRASRFPQGITSAEMRDEWVLGEEVGRSTPGKGNGGEDRPSSQKSRHLQAQQTSATRLQHAGRACLKTRRQRAGTATRAESSREPRRGWKQGGGVSVALSATG